MKTLRSPLILLLAALLCGCAGTDVGNPSDGGGVGLQFAAYDGAVDGDSLVLENGITIDAVWMSLDQVTFRDAAGCTETDEQAFQEAHVVELVSGVESPAWQVPLTESEYCRITFGFAPASINELPVFAPPQLASSHVVIIGQRADGESFELALELDELAFRAQGQQTLGSGEDVMAAFELQTWIQDTVVKRIEMLPADGLILSPGAEPALEAQLRNNIRRSARVLPDNNGDGRVQASEIQRAIANPEME